MAESTDTVKLDGSYCHKYPFEWDFASVQNMYLATCFFQFKLRARDNAGDLSRETEVDVTINILDLDDNDPTYAENVPVSNFVQSLISCLEFY